MSRADRAIGLARSLLVYHAIPRRQRRMQRLYRQFAQPGDLVFDIGAHVGNRARALAALGCRVIALEPQPDFARLLRLLFARNARIEVVEAAVTRRQRRGLAGGERAHADGVHHRRGVARGARARAGLWRRRVEPRASASAR